MVQANRVLFVSIRFFRFDQIRVNARIVGRNGVEKRWDGEREVGKNIEREKARVGERERREGEREGERDLPFRLHVASIDLLLRGAAFAKEPQSLVE